MDRTSERQACRRFADLLDYPQPGLAETAAECAALLGPAAPRAAELVGEFAAFARQCPAGRLEEVYTGAFDLDAACHPYVGYHLFGESYKRSVFLLELKQRLRAHGLDIGSEVPDHLAVVLRLLAATDDVELADELIGVAVVPALAKMTGEDTERERHPYDGVLRAVRLVLEQRVGGAVPAGEGGSSDD